MSVNPYMMILHADPARYIQKPAPTVLALAKSVEGACAVLGLLKIGGFLLDSLGSLSTVQILNISLTGLALKAALSLHEAFGALFPVFALGVLVALVCTVAEAAGLWALRVALAGSALLKYTRKVLLFDTVFLLLTTVAGIGMRMYHYTLHELSADPSMLKLRTILLTGAGCVLFLVVRLLYHRDVFTVFSAIEYEIRMEYKETVVDAPRLAAFAFLFAALSTAGAVLTARSIGYTSLPFFLLTAMAVKYFAVLGSWDGFQHCHR